MSEALRQEWWYDDDRQALMVGSWPYGRRATFDDIAPLRAALTQALAERDEYLAMLCEGARPVEEVIAELRDRLATAPNTKDGEG